jgi:hypothetical protein
MNELEQRKQKMRIKMALIIQNEIKSKGDKLIKTTILIT